jgi:hypothetical protein
MVITIRVDTPSADTFRNAWFTPAGTSMTSPYFLLPLSLAAPAFDPPLLGIVYLLCQVAVLRSNSEKQRFEFLVVSAGCASLVRGCPA